MLSMQFALAQHAGVHFFENGQFHSDHKPDHKHVTDKLCEACLISKHLSNGFHSADIEIFVSPIVATQLAQSFTALAHFHIARAYNARGPPILLS